MMWLARVRRLYPDELICDLAETYGVLEYEKLNVWLVVSLAGGLRANSRVFTRIRASQERKTENDVQSFDNADAFEAARRKIMEG